MKFLLKLVFTREVFILLKKTIGALLGLVVLGSLGFLIYSNHVQDVELKELKELNDDLTVTVEELKDMIYEFETTEVSSETDPKILEIEQTLDDLNQRIQQIDDRVLDIELWQ